MAVNEMCVYFEDSKVEILVDFVLMAIACVFIMQFYYAMNRIQTCFIFAVSFFFFAFFVSVQQISFMFRPDEQCMQIFK